MADDIKKDAAAQRTKQAPQPRNREGGSLSGVIDEIKKGNEEQTKTTDNTTGLVANMVNIANSVEKVGLAGNAAIDTLANNLSGNKLKELENAKEGERRDERTNELLEALVDNTEPDSPDSPKGFFGTTLAVLAGLSGALVGVLGGFILGVGGQVAFIIKSFAKPFKALFSFLSTGLGKIIMKLPGVEGAKSGIAGISKYLKNLQRLFGGVDKTIRGPDGKLGKMNRFEKGIKQIGKFVRSIKEFPTIISNAVKGFAGNISSSVKGFLGKFKIPKAFNIGDDIKKAGDSLKSIKSAVAGFATPFTKTAAQASKLKNLVLMAISPFKMFGNFFKFFAAKFGPLGKILGKLFLPVTIIMGIFDGIKGAISGAAEEQGTADKFIGGIFGAIKGILVGLVGMPLDLLMDLVGWIAGKLGFENAGEALSNFSVSALIGNIIDVVRDFLGGVVDFAVGLFTFDGEKIKGGFGKITDVLGNFLKPILRSVLPDPSAELFSIAGLASKAIPDFIYEYAGINPSTGEMEPFENALTKGVMNTGEELNAGSVENEANKNKSSDVNQQAVVDQSVKQSSAQTINIMGGSNLATANELKFQFQG